MVHFGYFVLIIYDNLQFFYNIFRLPNNGTVPDCHQISKQRNRPLLPQFWGGPTEHHPLSVTVVCR